MKTRLLLSLALLFFAALSLYADDPALPVHANRPLIEKNLLVGLTSTNEGLRYSCALRLGEWKSTRAVIPLMAILKQCDNFKLKTAAAWALCNIGDPRGTCAVKREVAFSNCGKTKLVCAWYYENMVKSGSFVLRDVDVQLLAELKEER